MEHLDWLLTESKFVVIIADYIISHAHSTMQTNQSSDAESYQPNRSGGCCSAKATTGEVTNFLMGKMSLPKTIT